ncbi:MAG TPA: protein phosphatase 2C domain-containing protein [Phenylobacterium sp.]|jgi:serine/threonine protein phosphatase PrpC
MALRADISLGQSLGRRQRQEDRVTLVPDEAAPRFLVLADGMGGAVGGDVAATLITETVAAELLDVGLGGTPAGSALRAAAINANAALKARVKAEPELDGMGGTLVIVQLAADGLMFFSMGDSPLHLVRAGRCERLNADHSVGGMLDAQVARGELSAEAAASRRDRNSITSVVAGGSLRGMRMDETADLAPLAAGDVLVLASDGLDTLAPDEIAAICSQGRPSQEIVNGLLAAVEAADRPRQDNASVIVACFA